VRRGMFWDFFSGSHRSWLGSGRVRRRSMGKGRALGLEKTMRGSSWCQMAVFATPQSTDTLSLWLESALSGHPAAPPGTRERR